VSFGRWEGLVLAEILSDMGLHKRQRPVDWQFRSPDGESFETVRQRASGFLARAHRPAVAISHGLTGRVIRSLYGNSPIEDILGEPAPQDGFFRLADGQVDYIG